MLKTGHDMLVIALGDLIGHSGIWLGAGASLEGIIDQGYWPSKWAKTIWRCP